MRSPSTPCAPPCRPPCYPNVRAPAAGGAGLRCGSPGRDAAAADLDAEPADQHSGQQDNDSLLSELAQDTPARRAQRGPWEAKSLLRERGEKLHADRVRRKRVETGVGDEREAKSEGNARTSLVPLVATEEDDGGHRGDYEREGERMRDGTMAEE